MIKIYIYISKRLEKKIDQFNYYLFIKLYNILT